MVRWLVGLAWLAILGSGCAYPTAQPTRAKLRVIAEPADARVYVDERFVASARVLARRPRELRPGRHRLTFQAPGYFPHDVAVDLPPGTTTIRISLRPIPP